MRSALQRVHGLEPVAVDLQPDGKTDPMLFEELARAHGLPLGRLAARLEALQAEYAADLAALLLEDGACMPKRGVPRLLSALGRQSGVTLGIVSGNLERTARLKLDAAGLGRYFVAGAYGSDARRREDIVGIALRRFEARDCQFAARQVWVIGDTPDDVASGRANGTRTLAVATGRHDRETLGRCAADAVLDDLDDTASVVDILCRSG